MSINEKFTALADEIRELSGTDTPKGLDDMIADVDSANTEVDEQSGLIEQIAVALEGKAAGGEDRLAELLEGTITEYSNPTVTQTTAYAFINCISLTSVRLPACIGIQDSAFQNCFSLASISFPACTTIGNYAFSRCSMLTSINFPACTSMGASAFYCCTSLISASFPVCSSINAYAFYSCSRLTSINFPACTVIDRYAFNTCGSLISVNFPSCMTVGSYAFCRCSNLESVSFPACVVIGSYTFTDCFKLTSVNFPACRTINPGAFSRCSRITSVDLPSCVSIFTSAFIGCSGLSRVALGFDTLSASTAVYPNIYQMAFSECTNLTTLELYWPSVAALQGINAFQTTPMSNSSYTGSFGSIYVPASLVDAYKSATNWATYADRITALESLNSTN